MRRELMFGERGQMLIVTMLVMTAMLGITALAIDASFMYDKRNKLYAAADAAAKSAATEVFRDSTLTLANLQDFANQQVNAHGFTAVACGATGGASVCLYHPPQTG